MAVLAIYDFRNATKVRRGVAPSSSGTSTNSFTLKASRSHHTSATAYHPPRKLQSTIITLWCNCGVVWVSFCSHLSRSNDHHLQQVTWCTENCGPQTKRPLKPPTICEPNALGPTITQSDDPNNG